MGMGPMHRVVDPELYISLGAHRELLMNWGEEEGGVKDDQEEAAPVGSREAAKAAKAVRGPKGVRGPEQEQAPSPWLRCMVVRMG